MICNALIDVSNGCRHILIEITEAIKRPRVVPSLILIPCIPLPSACHTFANHSHKSLILNFVALFSGLQRNLLQHGDDDLKLQLIPDLFTT